MTTELRDRPADVQLLGYSALIEHYRLDCPRPRRLTAITPSGQKTTTIIAGTEWLLLPRGARFRIPDTPIEHLGVALKHEGVDLRVLDRLFRSGVERELADYIESNPAGKYTRRAWFLYEWLTGDLLSIAEPYGVRYVPALDPNIYVVRRPDMSVRHKVADNLPGVRGFCPLIRRTERLTEDRISGLAAEARRTVSDSDPGVLRRAVGFMLLSESRGSFGIEGETPPRNRLERWGRTIAEAAGIRLSIDTLIQLHRSLFDPKDRHIAYGLRSTGGFVGRHDRDNAPLPDHVSARPDDVADLLDALLRAFDLLKRTRFDPVLTAALIGFGFVFIHPFEDGNGRLHRFMIQKALADTRFNPEGVVLPVSASILEDLAGYRSALEEYSAVTLPNIDWEPTPEGNVHVLNDTRYLYQYFDATRQAEYLVDALERTVRLSLPAELAFLHRFDDAKRRMSDLVDLPDRLSSLLIRFCSQNGGVLSAQKRADYFPDLADDQVRSLEAAIRESGILAVAPTSPERG